LKAITISPNNIPSSETPDINIPELNTTKAPHHIYRLTAEEWAVRNASIACHDLWDPQPKQKSPWVYNIKIVLNKEKPSYLATAFTHRSQCNTPSAEASRSK